MALLAILAGACEEAALPADDGAAGATDMLAVLDGAGAIDTARVVDGPLHDDDAPRITDMAAVLDGRVDDGPGPLVCGSLTCGPQQACVRFLCQTCVAPVGGACPAGSIHAGYPGPPFCSPGDLGGACWSDDATDVDPPRCVDLPSTCTRACDCAALGCSLCFDNVDPRECDSYCL